MIDNLTPAPPHNYLDALLKAWDMGAFEKGEGYSVLVRHDDWCAFFTGGVCDCIPELEIEKVTP